eukprot:3033456-Rhodomonas_salina.1
MPYMCHHTLASRCLTCAIIILPPNALYVPSCSCLICVILCPALRSSLVWEVAGKVADLRVYPRLLTPQGPPPFMPALLPFMPALLPQMEGMLS